MAQDPQFSTLDNRKQREDELDKLVATWTLAKWPEEVMILMQSAGVPAGVVHSPKGLYSDPQLRYRQHFRFVDEPEMGPHSLPGYAFVLDKTQAEMRPAPLLGEHNETVFKEFLKTSEEEYARLLVEGVLE